MCPQSHYPISVWEWADAVQVFMVHMHWQKGLSELPDIKSWLPATNSVHVHDVVYCSVVLCDAQNDDSDKRNVLWVQSDQFHSPVPQFRTSQIEMAQ